MGIVYTPKEPHRCKPSLEGAPAVGGTVWRCDECGSHWVLLGERWYGEGPISKIRRWWRSRRVQR